MYRFERLFLLLGLFAAVPSTSRLFAQEIDPALFAEMRWRMIGPHRGGRTRALDPRLLDTGPPARAVRSR